MALDANIILSGNQQRQDPLATISNALNLSHSMENQRAAREERGRQELLRQATVIGPNGQIDEQATLRNIQGLVGPDAAGKLSHQFQSDRLARDKSAGENQKIALEVAEKKNKALGEVLSSLGPNPPLELLYREAQKFRETHMPELRLDELPESQDDVPVFMQQMNVKAQGISKHLENSRADFLANFQVTGPQGDAAKAAYDHRNYAQGAWDQFGGVPSQFGALQYPGVQTPTGQPANALAASPQGANGAPVAPGGIEVAAPAVPVYDYQTHLYQNFINKAKGDADKIADWGPDGKRIINQDVINAKKDIGAASASRNTVSIPYEKEIRKQRAQATAKIQEESRSATKTARDVGLIVESLGDLDGGPLQAKLQSMTKFFPWTKEVTNRVQLAEAIAARLGPSMRVLGSGSTSDWEAQQALLALPSLSMYKEGRAVLRKVFNEIAKRSRYEADVRDRIAGSDDDENMEQRVQEEMDKKFPDSILSKEDMVLVEEHTKGRKAKKHNVQSAPAVAPPKEMDFKDWSSQ